MVQLRYLSNIEHKYTVINEAKNAKASRKKDEKDKTENTTGKDDVGDVTDKPNKDLTLDEYKQKIKDSISKYKVDDSQSKTETAFNISDDALRRMKEDADYEKKILDKIKGELSTKYPSGSEPKYRIIRIGKEIDDYSAQNMEASHKDLFEANTKDSLWIKKPDTKKSAKTSNVPPAPQRSDTAGDHQKFFEQIKYEKTMANLRAQQFKK